MAYCVTPTSGKDNFVRKEKNQWLSSACGEGVQMKMLSTEDF